MHYNVLYKEDEQLRLSVCTPRTMQIKFKKPNLHVTFKRIR